MVKNFKWSPSDGCDIEALERMKRHFTRPYKPMGEAWFMGQERFLFEYLYEDIDSIPVNELMKALEEISSGTSSFGHLDEWSKWYHYLLGQLMLRSHEYYMDYLLEYLITGFMTQYPNGIKEQPYAQFEEDILNTLGKSIMNKQCWNGNDIVIGNVFCPSNNNPNKVWCWWDASGDFSSSLFFCLKYLPSQTVPSWFKSVLQIESPHWRAQLIVWLVGVHKILSREIKQLSEFCVNERPSVEWAWSHCIKGGAKHEGEFFIPEKNITAVIKVLEEEISEDLYFEWLESIYEYEYLEIELAEIPDTFANYYVYKKDER